MQPSSKRTDLAADAFASLGRNADISGAALSEYTLNSMPVTELTVSEASAADILCKPIGKYYTVDVGSCTIRSDSTLSAAANCLSTLLRRFDAVHRAKSFLIACLGNVNVTPDAIGPLCADSLIVSRHLIASQPDSFPALRSVAVCRTGVLGTSGIESADTVAAICREIKPDCVIAVDALATSESSRLCSTVQLCDSGISPGSGVGNNRTQLNHDSLGVPVIAIGVPTVIDASCFTDDSAVKGLFVTPRNIDELASASAKLIAYGINLALHDGLSIEDIDLLVE